MEQTITRDMTIEEVFKRFPSKAQKLAQEMTNRGLHCVGCSASTWETIEAGILGHGMNEEDLEDLLESLNAVLAEKEDRSTITITPRAAKKFLDILAEVGKTGWGLRFGERAAAEPLLPAGLAGGVQLRAPQQGSAAHGAQPLPGAWILCFRAARRARARDECGTDRRPDPGRAPGAH